MPSPYALLSLLLLTSVTLRPAAGEDPINLSLDPSEATLYSEGKEPQTVYVLADDMDGLTVCMERDKKDALARFNRKQVGRLEFLPTSDVHFHKGAQAAATGKWEVAVQSFTRAASNAPERKTRILALLGLAQAQTRLKQYDDAAASCANLVATFPKAVEVPEALFLAGEIRLSAGEWAKAEAAFRDLGTRAETLGRFHPPFASLSRALAGLGLAKAKRGQGRPDEAATLLETALRDADPAQFAKQYGLILAELAGCLMAQKKEDQALERWKALRFQPVDKALQAQACYEAAVLLDKKGQTIEAFDHAVMAIMRNGPVDKDARALASRLVAQFNKDAAISAEDKREYRTMLRGL